MSSLLGEGLLTSSEPIYRKMRGIVQLALHAARIAGYAWQIQRAAERFGGELTPEPFDMHSAMTELTLRIASQTPFWACAGGSAASVSMSLQGLMTRFSRFLTGPASCGYACRYRVRVALTHHAKSSTAW